MASYLHVAFAVDGEVAAVLGNPLGCASRISKKVRILVSVKLRFYQKSIRNRFVNLPSSLETKYCTVAIDNDAHIISHIVTSLIVYNVFSRK